MPQNTYQQPQQAEPIRGKGIVIAAIVTGGIAFLTGLAPVFGALAGIAAIALAVIALFKKQNKVLAWIALGLGVIAAISSITVTAVLASIGNNVAQEGTAQVEEPVTPEPTTTEEPEAEPEPAGTTDAERASRFEQDLKTGLGVQDSFQELLSDPSLWGGYIADIRYQTGNIYVTLQVNGSTPDGKDLGQRAAQALSTLMTQETVDAVDYSWVIVEDGSGTVIDQKQPKPIM